jgi:hypothetical protein
MKHRHPQRSRRLGVGLVHVVFGVFAATTVVSVMLTCDLSSSRKTALDGLRHRARYLASGAIEVAARDVSLALANERPVSTGGVVRIDGREVRYEVRATGDERRTETAEGVHTLCTGYEIAAEATVSGATHTEYRTIEAVAAPLFQFGLFHHGDLELDPVGDLTLDGRIHANGHLYLNSGGTLTLDTNHVTAAGHLYRDRKAGLAPRSGEVRIRRWVADPRDASAPVEFTESPSQLGLAGLGVSSISGYDSNFTRADGDWKPWGRGALERWSQPAGYGQRGSTVRTRAHGVRSIAAPGLETIALNGPLHRAAGLVLITRPDLSYTLVDAGGADVTSAFPDVVEVGELFDARQAGTTMADVLVTRVDVWRLGELGGLQATGLLYAAWSSAGTGTRARGVVLANGSRLAAPLTVASENPVYLLGDYNTLDPVPAAVLADAVNLLSNAWDGSKEHNQLPRATATTYNVALAAGGTSTVGAGYGGGILNLARLHEDWGGVALTLRGSLVCGWESRYATGRFESGGQHFVPPLREITYQVGFDAQGGLPPFTPSVVATVEVAGS